MGWASRHLCPEARRPGPGGHHDGAGEEAQVDYGDGPMVRDPASGKCRRTRHFVLMTILQRAAGRRAHAERRPRRGAVPPRRFVR